MKKLKYFFKYLWEESPWIRPTSYIGGLLGGLTILYRNLPEELSVDIGEYPDLFLHFIYGCIILYLFLVVVFSGNRLHFEKRLREMEQSFKYDKRGTLYNGFEPNIAFRIATFKGILNGLYKAFDSTLLYDSFIEIGRSASKDFASQFDSIYESDIAMKRVGKSWHEIPLSEKLSAWADYDSATGWGILTCKIKDIDIDVKITHLNGLYLGEEGKLFGAFMAGYCKTVISGIANSQTGGKYHDCDNASIKKVELINDETILFSFELK